MVLSCSISENNPQKRNAKYFNLYENFQSLRSSRSLQANEIMRVNAHCTDNDILINGVIKRFIVDSEHKVPFGSKHSRKGYNKRI